MVDVARSVGLVPGWRALPCSRPGKTTGPGQPLAGDVRERGGAAVGTRSGAAQDRLGRRYSPISRRLCQWWHS